MTQGVNKSKKARRTVSKPGPLFQNPPGDTKTAAGRIADQVLGFLDRDSDGKISPDERKSLKSRQTFESRFDLDRDGTVTRQELVDSVKGILDANAKLS